MARDHSYRVCQQFLRRRGVFNVRSLPCSLTIAVPSCYVNDWADLQFFVCVAIRSCWSRFYITTAELSIMPKLFGRWLPHPCQFRLQRIGIEGGVKARRAR